MIVDEGADVARQVASQSYDDPVFRIVFEDN